MKCLNFACVLCVLFAVSYAAPFFPAQGSLSASVQAGSGNASGGVNVSGGANGLTNILQNIDLPGLLRGVNSFVQLVGQFCPPLSQILDNVIQNVTSTAFRVFGRIILQQGGLGGGANGGGGGGQKVNVVLPTFPPDEDDEDYEDNENNDISSSTSTSTTQSSTDSEASTSAAAVNLSALYTSPASDDNTIAKRHVRVPREAEAEEEEEEADEDQNVAESAPEPAEDLSNVDTDDQDRNKRYSPFGGAVDAHGQAAGGSGNFLFDIIRNTADRAGRTLGTVYRMIAGTENLGWGLTATAESSRGLAPLQLVAGSGATEEADEHAGAGGVAEVDVAKAGDHGEGIPGPITRLFVIANRGLANLVQDLILRLAQTSERLVNFKARLVTALI